MGVASLLWRLASDDEALNGTARIQPHGLEAVVPTLKKRKDGENDDGENGASDANTKLVKTLESDMENASQALRVVDLANDALVGEVEQVLGLYQIPTLFAHKRLTLFFHNHSCARSSQRR